MIGVIESRTVNRRRMWAELPGRESGKMKGRVASQRKQDEQDGDEVESPAGGSRMRRTEMK